jgi:dTDP-4-dehydrorhamnose reductase
MQRSGHWDRIEDLDRFAALGIKAIRYPALWEHIAPDGLGSADWTWADERLGRLKKLGVRPIVGLTHHGSGPRHTSLVDPGFVTGLATYARATAERYPWVRDFTPVNEPLTTARFSALYGHWYPHGKDYPTFARALVVQCRAVAESMRAIREVTPGARLIQTEDMGRTFSTPHLAYQAEFENHRRWLSLDLLCGRLDPNHPLWERMLEWGVSEAELRYFLDSPCPPDVVGLNYYMTSDRVLDERMERYPEWSHGGNERDAYADVESVRAWPGEIAGHRLLLSAAWERYRLPVAFTEVHLGCTREEQLRWLKEAWDACVGLRAEGADVRALTVWSLLGAYDWNTLVTADRGFYEPGVYDLRGGGPRPTALATMTRELATRGTFEHPVLQSVGWWRRPDRYWIPPQEFGPHDASASPPPPPRPTGRAAPILIVGANGTLGRAFARLCALRGLEYRLLSRQDMDIASMRSVDQALRRFEPWAIVNAAGYVRVDDAEVDRDRCFRENAIGPALLAEACSAHGLRLVTYSSDLVFGGGRSSPYLESHGVSPLNVYGLSKMEAERAVLDQLPSALVVRTGAFFGPWDQYNFLHLALGALSRGERFRAADDTVVSPTYVPDLVHASLDLLVDGERGVWHLTNTGEVTWAELARTGAEAAGLDASDVEGCPMADFGLPAARPRYSPLSSERGLLLPKLEDAIVRYVRERDGRPAESRVDIRIDGGGRESCGSEGGIAEGGLA